MNRSHFSPLKAILAAWFLISPGLQLSAAPIPVGTNSCTLGEGRDAIQIFTYKPAKYQDGPLLVVFHGVNRNAADYRNYAIAVADKFNLVVATPFFDKERFPAEAYSRGGITKKGVVQPREKWTYAAVPKIVADVRAKEGRPTLPYYLLGHSAGGQFLERLAAFQPTEAQRIVAANPGSHLFPRRDWDFHYGFGKLPPELSDDAALQRYLATPLTIFLGAGDVKTDDPNLDRSEAALREGPYRLERGRACFAYAQKLAAEHGWTFNWRKIETPGIGHDAKGMFAAPEIGAALFGARP